MFSRLKDIYNNIFGKPRVEPKLEQEQTNDVQTRRRFDAAMVVQQNNPIQKIYITNVNDNALKLLNYNKAELVGHDIREFLDAHVVELLNEYVEFEATGNDFADVMRRARDIHMLRKNESALPITLDITRRLSNMSKLYYQIFIHDKSLAELAELYTSPQNQDPATKLVMGNALYEGIRGVRQFAERNEVDLTYVMFALNNAAAFGDELANVIFEIGNIIKNQIRATDVVGLVEPDIISLVLPYCDVEHAPIVIYRIVEDLHGSTYNIGDRRVEISMTIVYTDVDFNYKVLEIFNNAVQQVKQARSVNESGPALNRLEKLSHNDRSNNQPINNTAQAELDKG